MTVFQLSIEEVTFALGFLGGADVAAGYLTAITGQLSTDELAGRVTAATHSLLARDLLIIDSVSGDGSMNPDLRETIAALMTGENSLRVTVTTQGLDEVVTFFLDGDRPVRHQLIQDVVTRLVLLPDIDAVAEDIVRMMCPVALEEPAESIRVDVIPADILRQARLLAATASAAQQMALLQRVLPVETAARLASDFGDAQARWGAVLRLSTGTGETLEANQGFFTVALADHGWLFDLASDPARADVYLLNASSVQKATRQLTIQDRGRTENALPASAKSVLS